MPVRRDASGLLELRSLRRRRIDVQPAHAEAAAGWPQPVAEDRRQHLAVLDDHDPVELRSLDELLEHRLAAGRRRDGGGHGCRCVLGGLDPREPHLAGGVGGLQHGGKPHHAYGGPSLVRRPHGREARLRRSGLREPTPHGELVRHQARGLDADPGQVECLGDRGHHGDGALGLHCQHTVDREVADVLEHRLGAPEVHDPRDVRQAEPGRVGIAVDGDDTKAELPRTANHRALIPAGAHDEDGLHRAAGYRPADANRAI